MLFAWLCLFSASILSAPLPGSTFAPEDGGIWPRTSAGITPPFSPNPIAPQELPVTAILSILRTNKGKFNEQWALLVNAGSVTLTPTEVHDLRAQSQPQRDPITDFQSTNKLTIQGMVWDKPDVPLEGDVYTTDPSVTTSDFPIATVKINARSAYIAWLKGIHGRKPLTFTPLQGPGGNELEFIDWALLKLGVVPRADMHRWQTYKREWTNKVQDATWGSWKDRNPSPSPSPPSSPSSSSDSESSSGSGGNGGPRKRPRLSPGAKSRPGKSPSPGGKDGKCGKGGKSPAPGGGSTGATVAVN